VGGSKEVLNERGNSLMRKEYARHSPSLNRAAQTRGKPSTGTIKKRNQSISSRLNLGGERANAGQSGGNLCERKGGLLGQRREEFPWEHYSLGQNTLHRHEKGVGTQQREGRDRRESLGKEDLMMRSRKVMWARENRSLGRRRGGLF